MKVLEHFDIKTAQWDVASAYEKFEQVVVLILTGLIIVVIASAVWHLAIKVLFGLVLASGTDLVVASVVVSVITAIASVPRTRPRYAASTARSRGEPAIGG